MTMTDPIADFLTRVRNALLAKKNEVSIPLSIFKRDMAKVLKEEGFIRDYIVAGDGVNATIDVKLKYSNEGKSVIHNLDRVSRPGRRVYRGKADVPNFRNGFGIYILTTPKGIMSDRIARKTGVGGEVVCSVW